MAVKKHGLNPDDNAPANMGMLPYYLDNSLVYSLPPNEVIKRCKAIIVLLSKISIPKDPAQHHAFYIQVQNVEEYLKKIIIDIEQNAKGRNLIFGLLKQFYLIISTATPSTSPAICIVLSLLSADVRSVAIGYFVKLATDRSAIGEEGNESAGSVSSAAAVAEHESSLVKSMITLCSWLCYWEGTPALEEWIIEIIKTLEKTKKYDILFDVSNIVVGELFFALQIPSIRKSVINVFLHILGSTRDSIETFDRIADMIPKVLESLTGDTSAESRSMLQNLVEAFGTLLDLHPEYKEQYSEIVSCLDAHIKSNSGMIMEFPVWMRDSVELPPQKKDANAKVGLLNLGNTCYMNSALQALFMTKQFSNGIVISNLKFPLVCKLKSLFAHMMFSDMQFLNPKEVHNSCRPVNFPRGTQQDTSEFINHLLDRLHMFENYSLSYKNSSGNALKPSTADSPSSSTSCSSVPQEAHPSEDSSSRKRSADSSEMAGGKRRCIRPEETVHQERDRDSENPQTIVQKVFAGVMNTSTCCLNCDHVSSKKDAFWDLQLAFPEKPLSADHYSISNLLEYFCSPEKLELDNRYQCQNCDSLQDAQRSVTIESAPKNLIVVLKQFFYDPKRRLRDKLLHRVKLNKHITLMERDAVRRYELYAVIVHTGVNLDSGHYYTIARDSPHTWYILDDSEVTEVSEQVVYSLNDVSTPYIIFYKRLDETNPVREARTDNEIDFNPNEDTLPYAFLPSYLVHQLKNAHHSHFSQHVMLRCKDEEQAGSSQY